LLNIPFDSVVKSKLTSSRKDREFRVRWLNTGGIFVPETRAKEHNLHVFHKIFQAFRSTRCDSAIDHSLQKLLAKGVVAKLHAPGTNVLAA
jgi:hypothetical protein